MSTDFPAYFNQASNLYTFCEKLEVKCKDGSISDQERPDITQLAQQILQLSTSISELKTTPSLGENDRRLCQDLDRICEDLLTRASRVAGHLQKSIHISPEGYGPREAVLVEKFQTEPIRPSAFNRFVKAITPNLFNTLRNLGYEKVFPIYSHKVRLKQQLAEIHELKIKLKNLLEEIEGLETKRKMPSKKQIKNLHLKKFNIERQIATLNGNTEEALLLLAKGKETRTLLEALGGDRTRIPSSEGAVLDGCFISSDKFRGKLAASGKEFTLTRRFPDGHISQISGLSFRRADVDSDPNHVVNLLKKMHAFPEHSEGSSPGAGAGWNLVADGDNLLLVPDSYMQDIVCNLPTSHPLILPGNPPVLVQQYINAEKVPLDIVDERSYQDIDLSSTNARTVILTTGNAGLYEMHKTEIAAFLLKGMNVQCFNFRGMGESEGTPHAKGLEHDYEEVYRYVKDKTHQPDSSILLMPLCMSGGAAAKVAGRHPELNLFLNQTYSDFQQAFQDGLIAKINHYIQQKKEEDESYAAISSRLTSWALHAIQPIARYVAGIVAPDLHVAKHLAKNRGHKAIFFTHDDTTMPRHHVDKNIAAVAKAGGLEKLSVYSAPGEHATPWLEVVSAPQNYDPYFNRQKALRNKELNENSKEFDENIKKIDESKAAILSEGKAKAQALRNVADEMTQKHQKSRKIGSKRMTPHDIVKYASKVEKEAQAQYNELQERADSLQAQSMAELQELRQTPVGDLPPEMRLWSFTGRNQVSHFLDKAHLSDDIIKSQFQLNKVKNPVLFELGMDQKYVDQALADLSPLVTAFGPLSDIHIVSHRLTPNGHVFACMDAAGNAQKISASHEQMDKLANLTDLAYRMSRVAERTQSPSPNQLKVLNSAVNLAEFINAYDVQQNSRMGGIFMDQIADLSKRYDTIHEALMIAIESKIQVNIVTQLNNLDSLRDNLVELSNAMEEQLKELPHFPNEVKNALAEGLLKTSTNIDNLHRYFVSIA